MPRPGDDLGAPAREQIERRVFLEHAHGVGGGEDRHRAREADRLRLCRDRSERHGRRGHREIEPVVLAEGEHGKPRAVGELRLREHFLQALARRVSRAPVTGSAVRSPKL